MTKPIILLDVDGVLVESTHRNLAKVNETWGTSYKYEDVTDFNYSFMPEKHVRYIYKHCWHDPTLYDEASLEPMQLMVIAGLREIGRVVACSSPLEGHIQSKWRFLRHYFDRQDIVLAPDKSLVAGDILIDDAIHNLKAFPGHGIIYDRPWNQNCNAPRAMTFDDIGPLVLDYILERPEDYDLRI